MSYPIIRFCNGHISIKRGRITRKYSYNKSLVRHDRLANILIRDDSPVDYKYTQRSSVYVWYSAKYLPKDHKEILRMRAEFYQKWDDTFQPNNFRPQYRKLYRCQYETMTDLAIRLGIPECLFGDFDPNDYTSEYYNF